MLLDRPVLSAALRLWPDDVGCRNNREYRQRRHQHRMARYASYAELPDQETFKALLMLTVLCRQSFLCDWRCHLPPRQLGLHRRRIHTRGLDHDDRGLRYAAHRADQPTRDIPYRQEQRRDAVLQKVPGAQTRPRAPLLHVQAVRPKDGSPLPVAGDMRWPAQLQGLSALPLLHNTALLLLFCRQWHLGLDANHQRHH